MKTLGIILARSGSVGLPNKHLRPLGGRPVICHTFEHARAAKLLSRVCVTSDCPVIRRFALAEGFDVIERPKGIKDASLKEDRA